MPPSTAATTICSVNPWGNGKRRRTTSSKTIPDLQASETAMPRSRTATFPPISRPKQRARSKGRARATLRTSFRRPTSRERRGARPRRSALSSNIALAMSDLTHDPDRLRRVILVVVALGITLLFLGMISEFLIALLLAALAAGIMQPLYKPLVKRLRGRRTLASGISVVLLFVLGIGPIVVFAIIVGMQAVEVAQAVG